MKTNTRCLFFISLLTCLSLSPKTQAVTPAPDGAYPGGNTAEGQNALLGLTTGGYNTAVGYFSLSSDSTNSFNTAVGAGALLFTTADQNTAIGVGALLNNTIGEQNTASGVFALFSNTFGTSNAANGGFALFGNTTGELNTADGDGALANNSTGNGNTAVGFQALFSNTTGSNNVALGAGAGSNVATASNVTAIGSSGADVSSTTWIGNVYGVTTQSGMTAPVIVSNTGQLGTISSSERFKKDIASMEKASEAVLALRPVTFHYKTDVKGTPQFGLIAEEVTKVNPALVLCDKEGKPFTVRYDAVNAMLLNEFLKEHRKVEEITRDFQATVAQLTARLDEQAARIQKVSAQLEASKPATQTVLNNQ